MDPLITSSKAERTTPRIWVIVVAIVVFAGLMALRYELSSVWARAATAACAFLVLGWGLWALKPRG